MKVSDSNIQSTQLHCWDPKLNYYNPHLFIVTHKDHPNVIDVRAEKKPCHLEEYLNMPKPRVHQTNPTMANLSVAESALKQKVSKNAPTKAYKDF